MKQLMLLFALCILLSGCEKERCFRCVTTYSGVNYSPDEIIVCGTMTRKEAKEEAGSASVSSGGITIHVTCTEL